MNVCVVGLGFMGATHVKAWSKIHAIRLYAAVDADSRRLTGDLSSVGGNLGAAAGKYDFSGVRGYGSLDEALTDPGIDVIDICLPTDQHAATVTAALRAGKHVLTEKPMALDSATAESLCREAQICGRILMAAHVLRFFPAYELLTERIRAGAAVRSALFRRRCAAPVWNLWLKDPARSGGAPLDLLIHDADFCISLWGMPESVRARGYCDPNRGIDVIHADLLYPGLGPVVITGGFHHPNSYPWSAEFTVVSDAATLEWSSAAKDFREYSENGQALPIPLEESDPFEAELAYFAACVASSVQPERCPPEQSAMAVALIGMMVESREKQGAPIRC